MDNPGTGETKTPLSAQGDKTLRTLIDTLRPPSGGGGGVGMVGVSFAGLWAAKMAINGDIDAAITLGGPVGAQLVDDLTALPNGMAGILAHTAGMNHSPTADQFRQLQRVLSLREQGLFDRVPAAPILAVNGEHDQYIPTADTTVFAHYPGCEAWLVRNATHCAAERLTTVMPAAVMWLVARLTQNRIDRLKARALKPLAARSLVKNIEP